jgi:hypothetical protein
LAGSREKNGTAHEKSRYAGRMSLRDVAGQEKE